MKPKLAQRLRSLIPLLVERSTSGQMEWQALATNGFVHSLPGSGVLMLTKFGERYKLSLLNATLKDVDVEEEDQTGQIAKLFVLLEQRTLKADETFGNLEKELGLK